MWFTIWTISALSLGTNAAAVGKAWEISPASNSGSVNRPSWSRQDSPASTSAFEVRSISGVGRLPVLDVPQDMEDYRRSGRGLEQFTDAFQEVENDQRSKREIEDFESEPEEFIEEPDFEEFLRSRRGLEDVEELESDDAYFDYVRSKRNSLTEGEFYYGIDEPRMHHFTKQHVNNMKKQRVRRDAAETKMEKIAGVKSVREARLNSPETWSKQPISVEFRHHSNLDQIPHENGQMSRNHQAPKTDFVTSHRRDFPESRESREMPAMARAYDEYFPLYHVRERDFDVPIPRGFYPDRSRAERDFYSRRLSDSPYFYNHYNEDDINPYGRAYPSTKPKRIIYYATLPEVVRKPIDLRSYRGRPYDDTVRSPPVAVASSSFYKRVPGNVDPNQLRYRSRYPYDSFDSYSRREYPYKRPYASYKARDEEDLPQDRAALKESPGNQEMNVSNQDHKLSNQISGREDSRLPWPVQIGTEVNIKEDERIPGRKIFGQIDEFNNRYQSAQLQNAPETSGPSNDQNNN